MPKVKLRFNFLYFGGHLVSEVIDDAHITRTARSATSLLAFSFMVEGSIAGASSAHSIRFARFRSRGYFPLARRQKPRTRKCVTWKMHPNEGIST